MKFAVGRTRPNGDPRSFPSGHATATFATAMVLQDHYGWKVGVPFFAAATYTAISRVTIKKHWASDVTMGAFVGVASARTVTLHLRKTRFAMAPYAVPLGGAWDSSPSPNRSALLVRRQTMTGRRQPENGPATVYRTPGTGHRVPVLTVLAGGTAR